MKDESLYLNRTKEEFSEEKFRSVYPKLMVDTWLKDSWERLTKIFHIPGKYNDEDVRFCRWAMYYTEATPLQKVAADMFSDKMKEVFY